MSNYPFDFDDDATIPRIENNITELADITVNALRDVAFSVEAELGLGASGSMGSVAARLNVSILANGTINPSALTGLGLVVLPITNAEISPTAAIAESKLNLTHTTSSLYTLYQSLTTSVNTINGFISTIGIQVSPHIAGSAYNHLLEHIKINSSSVYRNRFNLNRNNTNSNTLLLDINSDISNHERADGTVPGTPATFQTLSGEVVPSEFAHAASGIHINPSTFSTIPQANDDLQKFAEYVDSSSLLLIGGRIQNLYANGIPRTSRSEMLLVDGYGEPVVSPTTATSYLRGVPPAGSPLTEPFDDINGGDDVVLFNPSGTAQSTNNF